MLTTDPDHLVALPPGTARLALIHDASPIMPVTSIVISLADLTTLLEHLDSLGAPTSEASRRLGVAHQCDEEDHMHLLDLFVTAAEIDEVVTWTLARRCG